MDDRLLAPCTADLLSGWVGPVHGYVWDGIPVLAVCVGVIEDDGRVLLWSEAGDAKVRPSDLSLDLSLAECRDRVARALASRECDTTAPVADLVALPPAERVARLVALLRACPDEAVEAVDACRVARAWDPHCSRRYGLNWAQASIPLWVAFAPLGYDAALLADGWVLASGVKP